MTTTTLRCDACPVGCGAVLSITGERGASAPIRQVCLRYPSLDGRTNWHVAKRTGKVYL